MTVARSERLLVLLQALRRHRRPVSGATLAAETGVSLRTLYRDIASLQAQGAHIEGEAGLGYVLKPGFLLPPMMFSPDEIEALVLGSRWVAKVADSKLATAASDALAKIAAVLPADLRDETDTSTLLVGPRRQHPVEIDLAMLRAAIRRQDVLHLVYADEAGAQSQRFIWPFALGFFEEVRVLITWCELRQDFRHFRTDRMIAIESAGRRYAKRRATLLRQWREVHGMTHDM